MGLMKHILVINVGSSSVKISLFEKSSKTICETLTGELHFDRKFLVFNFKEKEKPSRILLKKRGQKELIGALLIKLKAQLDKLSIDYVAHRIVHGGPYFKKSCQITSFVKNSLKKLYPLAPLHNPLELFTIELSEKLWPKATHVAHFDTAFFQDLPDSKKRLPLPEKLCSKEMIRYGFHGISHRYCLEQLKKKIKGKKNSSKIIICHLGGGCSLSAIAQNTCVDTTMGFSPLEGLIMGTRPGSIDPGVLVYLLKNKRLSLKKLEEALQHQSGLLGISNLSSNLDKLLKEESKNSKAKLAVEMYIQSLSEHIAMMCCSLNGCDHLVFTGGIGEHLWKVRQRAISKLQFLGFNLDISKNKQPKNIPISKQGSSAKIWAISTNENWMMAKETLTLFKGKT